MPDGVFSHSKAGFAAFVLRGVFGRIGRRARAAGKRGGGDERQKLELHIVGERVR